MFKDQNLPQAQLKTLETTVANQNIEEISKEKEQIEWEKRAERRQ